jgi:superfamily II DNA/RNA helicase
LENDIKIFEEMKSLVKDIRPEDDDKLQKLIELLNKKEIKGKKVLIFSCFESTVRYLYENLKDKFEKVDFICGGEKILHKIKHFAPKSNEAIRIHFDPNKEIQILITTELLSEGLNLQDGQVIINYELHWNPVRIIQRIGRIDRIAKPGEKPIHDEIYVYNFFPETKAEKEIKVEDKVRNRIEEIIQNFGYDEKTISIDEPTVRKKLFEIYTELPEGIEEIEKKSPAKYFEQEFNRLKERYLDEYQKACELPAMVNIAKKHKKEGIIVFCRADDYYRLKLVKLNGEIISSDDWEILKILECKPGEKGEQFNRDYFEIVEKIRDEFEKEANEREQEKLKITDPLKKEFEKLIEWLKRKESREIKEKFDNLLNFVMEKQINFEQEKILRKIVRSYKKKFGLAKKEILKNLEKEIYPLLKDSPRIIKPEPTQKYAQVIIVAELRR